MRRLACLAAIAALTACQQPAEPAPAPAPVPEPAPPTMPSADWQSISSGEGVGLSLIQAGQLVITLSCLRSPEGFRVTVPGFTKIASEERLSVGAGDEAFVLVADLALDQPGVVATGEIPTGFLDRIEQGGAVSASYGAQTSGPHPAPSAEQARTFLTDCREIAG